MTVVSLEISGGQTQYRALEFFAGVGLARAGMEAANIRTVWANDYDERKFEMYAAEWGAEDYLLEDVHNVQGADVPTADIAWSSSPCTDLSLAGKRDGLRGGRESSAFFGFVKVLREMGERRPAVVVLENVTGLASSHGGDDLRAVIQEFNALGYVCDVVALDARRFIPQSRPRLFVIGSMTPLKSEEDTSVLRSGLEWVHQEPHLETFKVPLPEAPELLSTGLTQLLEELPDDDARWWESERVERFVESMSPVQRGRLDALVAAETVSARTAFRRTRQGVPAWEMRVEDISGCLRTARGGSSKQAVAVMGNGKLKVRWMTGREYSRLMGAGWFHIDSLRDSQVHYGFGDAVAVPVVTWLSEQALVPLIELHASQRSPLRA